ncbi:MAG: alkaline phosphatase D family protein [Thermoleophilia bacterium]
MRPTSAVLWTRAPAAGEVVLVVDGGGRRRVLRTTVDASSDLTVSFRPRGLRPATKYRYRFRQGDARSVAGTFTTAPRARAAVPVTFTWSGDSDGALDPRTGEPGYGAFPVLWRAARERPAFFAYLGDTIYADSRYTRRAEGLADLRSAYRQNRVIASLRSLERRVPIVAMWDDHEVRNDWYPGSLPSSLVAAGRRAFQEYQPLAVAPAGPLYRSFRWGANLEVFLLDLRSYRSAPADDACRNPPGEGVPDVLPTGSDRARSLLGNVVPQLRRPVPAACLAAIRRADRTLLGKAQRDWLLDRLDRSTATWKVVFTPDPMQHIGLYPYDRWEGYEAERRRVLGEIGRRGVRNVVWLATDTHANLFQEIRSQGEDTGMAEMVVGPIGTVTLGTVIRELAGPLGVLAAGTYLASQGTRCIELDEQSYGVATATASTLVLDARGADGRSLCGGAITLRAR